MTRLILIAAVIALTLTSPGVAVYAQDQEKVPTTAREETSRKTLELFDEYGQIGHCDETARLDNFAITLQTSPSSIGYIVTYGPTGSRLLFAERALDYLVNSRGMNSEHFKIIQGGQNNPLAKIKLELWVGPPEAGEPKLNDNKASLKNFRGKLSEDDFWDGVPDYYDEEFAGPPGRHVATEALIDIHKQQPSSMVYIVGYSAKDAVPGAWRRAAEARAAELKDSTVDSSHLKTVYGGLAQETKVQLWIQPANEPTPIKDKGQEKMPGRAVQFGDFHSHSLGVSKKERAVFGRLVEVLKGSNSTRAVVIVRLPGLKEEPEEPESAGQAFVAEDMAEPDLEPPSPPADLLKLVEKWKVELAEKHKIREDRFIVFYSTAEDNYSGYLETWIVPPGKPLPTLNSAAEEAQKETEKWEAEEKRRGATQQPDK